MQDIPGSIHIQNIAPNLSLTDWRSMQLTCRALRAHYQHAALWRWRAQNMPVLPEFLFDHPDFNRYNFDFRKLVQILMMGGDGLAKILKPSVEPWQIAALLGMHDKLTEIYGDDIVELADENQHHVVDYYLFGGHEDTFFAFIRECNNTFSVEDDPEYRFPILAAKLGNISMMQKLVTEFGYNIKIYFQHHQCTLLHSAVSNGHRRMAEWLITQGVAVDQGKCIAISAAEGGYWQLYHYLYSQKVKIDYNSATTIARFAAQHGNKALFESICHEFRINIAKFNKESKVQLFSYVISGGNFDMVMYFIEQKFGSEKKLSSDGKYSIHHAAEHGQIALIPRLIETFPKKLFADIQDKFGNNIILYSAKHGCLRKTEELCQLYFSPEDLLKPNKLGETICHLAAAKKRLNFLHLLRKKFGDAPLQVLDKTQNSVLHHACYHGASILSLWLIHTVKLSFTAQNKDGNTPLHLLAIQALKTPTLWADFETIARSIDYAAIVKIKNRKKQTIHDLMLAGNHEDLATSLAERPQPVNIQCDSQPQVSTYK